MTLASKMEKLSRAFRRGVHRPLDERVLFLHVPKCGGNSIRTALRGAYNWPLSKSRRRFFNVSPRRSRRVAEMVGRPVGDVRDELLRYHLLDERVRLATGHFLWPEGLREQFPDVCFVTTLREPVSRFLSAYYAARAGRAAPASRTTASLEAFLDSEEARRVGSSYVSFFARAAPKEALEPDALELAKRRLVSVEVLGVLEDLPGFVAAFEQRFGARLVIPRANVGGLRRQRERTEVTEAIREGIAELVRPDQILYDFVVGEIASRKSADAS